MTQSDQQSVAAWRLPAAGAHLTQLKRSLGSSQAIVPHALNRVSTTLEDVRKDVQKNGQQLLTSAQTALTGLQGSEDWALLRRVGTPADARRASMRRVASDTNFHRSRGRLLLQRPPAPAAGREQRSLSGEDQRQADAWTWLAALNSSLNQARAAQQSKFALSRAGLEEQVREGGAGAGVWASGRRAGASHCSPLPVGGSAGTWYRAAGCNASLAVGPCMPLFIRGP